MAKKLTPYQKEIQKLKRRIKTAEKAGYIFPDEIKIPRSTKQVHELRGNKLYSKATGYTSKSGEYFETPPTAKEKRRIEKDYRESQYYGYEWEEPQINDEILLGIEERMETIEYELLSMGMSEGAYQYHIYNRDYLRGLLDLAIADEGRDVVARRLNSYGDATHINELVDRICLDSDDSKVQASITEFSRIIFNGSITQSQNERISIDYGY